MALSLIPSQSQQVASRHYLLCIFRMLYHGLDYAVSPSTFHLPPHVRICFIQKKKAVQSVKYIKQQPKTEIKSLYL